MTNAQTIEAQPVWRVVVTDEETTFNDRPITPAAGESPFEAVVAAAITEARNVYGLHRPVRVAATAHGDAYGFAVQGDGTVTELEEVPESLEPVELEPETLEAVKLEGGPELEGTRDGGASRVEPVSTLDDYDDEAEAATGEHVEHVEPVSGPDDDAQADEDAAAVEPVADVMPVPRRAQPVEVDPSAWERVTFAPENRQQARALRAIEKPQLRATPTGWAKVAAAFGAQPQPSAADHARYEREMDEYRATLAQAEDEVAVSHRFVGPRVVAVANGKGGAGKTPFSLMLAAVFGLYGSASAYLDNNETRGTGGDRTAQDEHRATVRDLLARHEHLTSAAASAGDLAAFSHHQKADKFDVFQSVPDEMDTAQQLDGEQLHHVMQVLRRFYHYVIVDSGNNQSGSNWLAMADEADVMVVPMNAKDDHVKNAKRLLRDLATKHGDHGRELARRAVVVVTQASPAQDVAGVAEQFATLARHVVTVAYDPALEADWLQYGNLDPATQRSLLQLGAAVVETIEAADQARRQSA